MEQIKLDTPLIYLTVEQFTFLLQKYLSPQVSVKISTLILWYQHFL